MQLPSDRLKRKVEKENLWVFVLSVLSGSDFTGSEIKKLVTKKFGFLTGNVTVYKVLYLLEKGGYVSSSKKGKAVVYKITLKGGKELEKARDFLIETGRSI
ncbi:MAG TPA: PadR family transcriptional regulator [archaeon]|nr:PadR family transcriptional regulator [archaeon]